MTNIQFLTDTQKDRDKRYVLLVTCISHNDGLQNAD